MIWKEGFKNVVYPCTATIKYDGTYQQIIQGNTGYSKRGIKRIFPFLELPENKTYYAEMIRGEGKNRYEEFASTSKERYRIVLLDYESQEPYNKRIENICQFKSDNVIVPEIKSCTCKPELEEYFKEVVQAGYEGVVAKCGKYRVKLKANYTTDLIVKGKAKDREAVLLGSLTENYCFASCLGKTSLLDAIRGVKIIGENKDAYLFESKIVVEVKHYGVIRTNGIAFRNPDIKRVRFDKGIEDIKEVE